MDDLNNIEKLYNEESNFNKTFQYKDEYWDDALALLKKAERAAFLKKLFSAGGALLILIVTTIALLTSFESYQLDHHVALNPSSDEVYLSNNSTQSNKTLPENNNQSSLNNSVYNEQSTNSSGIKTENNLGTNDNNLLSSTKNTKSINSSTANSNQSDDIPRNTKVNSNYPNNSGSDANDNTFNNLVTNRSEASNNSSEDNQNFQGRNDRDASSNEDNSEENRTSSSSANSTSLFSNVVEASRKDEVLITLNLLTIAKSKEGTLAGTDIKPTKIPLISLEENNRFTLVLNAGVQLNAGLNNNQVYFDLPYLGGEVYYQLSNKFNVSAGGSWYSRSGIGYLIQNTTTQYGFGKREITSITSYDKVYFAEIPFKLTYQVKPNHLIGVGGAYSILLGGSNRSWNNIADFGPNGLNNQEKQDLQNLGTIPETFTNSASVFASYEFRYNRFGIEGRYYHGLNDFTNDEQLGINQFDRNSRFLLTLKYLLLK